MANFLELANKRRELTEAREAIDKELKEMRHIRTSVIQEGDMVSLSLDRLSSVLDSLTGKEKRALETIIRQSKEKSQEIIHIVTKTSEKKIDGKRHFYMEIPWGKTLITIPAFVSQWVYYWNLDYTNCTSVRFVSFLSWENFVNRNWIYGRYYVKCTGSAPPILMPFKKSNLPMVQRLNKL